MSMYLHVHADPTTVPGQGKLGIYVNNVDKDGNLTRAELYHGYFPNNDWQEGTRIELWILATLRNVLAAAEAVVYQGFAHPEERLTLEPPERN